ncbi:MAG: hypothetical protein ACOCUR_01170 [Nanoarchaeota archaeon]
MSPKKSTKKSVAKNKTKANGLSNTKKTSSSKSLKRSTSKVASKKSVSPKRKPSIKLTKNPVGFFIKNIEQFEHSIDFDIPRGFLTAFVFMLIAQAISFIGISMNKFYYTHVDYSGLWSELITPVAGQIPPLFFLYSALVSLFVGFIYAFFYHMVRVSIHGHAPHKSWVKGLLYGVFLVFVVGIPMMLNNYITFAAPNLLVVAWFAESVLTFLAGGVAIAFIMK